MLVITPSPSELYFLPPIMTETQAKTDFSEKAGSTEKVDETVAVVQVLSNEKGVLHEDGELLVYAV
ncbi:hypothetical protein DFH09DRAFT_1328246 [Mycena vulgaris]|nr:hypothetical protein DFH09DRAFT_1328246 [Mycena vulgaris]